MLELIVKVININLPNKHKLLEQCRPLYEYSWFIQRVKEYEKAGLNREDAITFAISDCKRENIMTEFMYEHGSEVANMLFGEYNEELEKQVIREEAYEDGYEAGEQRGECLKLICQVCRKLAKGKDSSVIAEELEESPEFIEKIVGAAEECNGNINQIYEKVKDF